MPFLFFFCFECQFCFTRSFLDVYGSTGRSRSGSPHSFSAFRLETPKAGEKLTFVFLFLYSFLHKILYGWCSLVLLVLPGFLSFLFLFLTDCHRRTFLSCPPTTHHHRTLGQFGESENGLSKCSEQFALERCHKMKLVRSSVTSEILIEKAAYIFS